MVQRRSLPKDFNPLMTPEHTPQLEILVERRRLGQTNLSVKAERVNNANATKPDNLGVFEYAHLRAPLPKDLKGSEIFAPNSNQAHPESYFLMRPQRRSSDGYVSATGMFKVAFPWAKHSEQESERKYLKGLSTTSPDEVAGNAWVEPEYGRHFSSERTSASQLNLCVALQLAEEYHIRPWIEALIDPEDIDKGAQDHKKSISPPPKFVPSDTKGHHPAPSATPSRGRGRPRSSSPSKIAMPSKKEKTPRKARTTRATNVANANAASASLQADLDSAAQAAESVASEDLSDGPHFTSGPHVTDTANRLDPNLGGGIDLLGPSETANVGIDSQVETNGVFEKTRTSLTFELPSGAPEYPTVESTEDMMAKAKQMVEEARKLDGPTTNGTKTSKRKAEELEEDDDDDDKDSKLPPAKRARVLEVALKKEKVRSRALMGLATTLAIGAIIPYVF
ncbi:MAG: hypothetical protein M1836_006237 [Candelina mexicana]|nr:MAG: hypothetical protein M1836_006237 [Candelina mexicana]